MEQPAAAGREEERAEDEPRVRGVRMSDAGGALLVHEQKFEDFHRNWSPGINMTSVKVLFFKINASNWLPCLVLKAKSTFEHLEIQNSQKIPSEQCNISRKLSKWRLFDQVAKRSVWLLPTGISVNDKLTKNATSFETVFHYNRKVIN